MAGLAKVTTGGAVRGGALAIVGFLAGCVAFGRRDRGLEEGPGSPGVTLPVSSVSLPIDSGEDGDGKEKWLWGVS